MSARNDGGAAFPHKAARTEATGVEGWSVYTPGDYPGLSLRDYFAAKAMQGLVAGGSTNAEEIGRAAFIVANAMLRARGTQC